MTAKRLTNANRSTLRKFADDALLEEFRQITESAYAKAEKLVRRDAKKQFPTRDLTVLRKYDATSRSAEVRVQHEHSFDSFAFRDEPLTAPKSNEYNLVIAVQQDTLDAVRALNALIAKTKEEQKPTRADYIALINGATTFSALCEHWPAAEVLSDRIVGPRTDVSTLSDDALHRIKRRNLAAPEQPAKTKTRRATPAQAVC